MNWGYKNMSSENKMGFDLVMRQIIKEQKNIKQPIYAIASFWNGEFIKFENIFTTDGDNDLEGIKKIFRERYAWRKNTLGVTEISHRLIKIDISEVLNELGDING